MRAIWKGAISFGLVNIPIALYPAIRKEEVKFHLLRRGDESSISYKRIADADGKEVPWDQIVKGFEYEKGRFAVLEKQDFEKVAAEGTQTIQITDFVSLDQIDPMFFDTPYYLEPQKGGDRAYALLREVLRQSGQVGIAKVVIKTRQHLAALKPRGAFLVLELMHFADDLQQPEGLKTPQTDDLQKKEMEMALTLVKSMSGRWEPQRYKDEYQNALMKLVDEKIQSGGKPAKGKAPKSKQATNVVDLIDMLQKSVDQSERGGAKKGKSRKERAA